MKLNGFKDSNKQGTKLIESSLTRNYFNLNFGHFQVGNLDGTPCKSNFLSKEVLAAVCQQWWNWVEVPSHVYLLLLWKTWIKQKKSRVNSNGFENNARGICKFLRPISISPESRWRAANTVGRSVAGSIAWNNNKPPPILLKVPTVPSPKKPRNPKLLWSLITNKARFGVLFWSWETKELIQYIFTSLVWTTLADYLVL